MLHSATSAHHRRRGVVLPMVALALVGLVGVTAIVIDGGLLLSNRRRVQTAADAAALAAAIELFTNSSTGTDTSGLAAASARKTASDNGFTDKQNGIAITVNIPPKSGAFTDVFGYAEVIIAMPQQRFFSTVFGSGDLPVTARAVARGSQNPRNNGLIVLAPSGSNDLNTTATGTVTVTGGDLVVDSSDAKGGTISSSGNIKAENLYFTGSPGYYTSNTGQFIATNGKIYSNQTPTPDPLKDLPPPDQPATVYSNVNISGLPKPGGSVPGWPDPANANGWILPAGTYQNGIHISDNNTAHTYTLQSGLFYFKGGGLSLSGSSAINCESQGVCLYFNSGGAISITANGPVTLSPLDSGPYANITVYEDRANTSQNSITGQTNGSLNVTGTIYLPAAKLTVTGSGGSYTLGSQYIVYQLSVTGSGNFFVDYSGRTAPPDRNLYLCE